MIRKIFCSLAFAVLAAGSLNAKTVTVSKTPSDNADFSEIQAAIDSFGQVKDLEGTPNIVQILDDAGYSEMFTINVHCSIIGDPVNRPRLYAKKNSASIGTAETALDGIVIRIPNTVATTGTTLLKNLIVLPAPGADRPQDDAIVTDGTTGFVHFDNLLITSQDGTNDGLGQPVSTDGLTQLPTPPNAIAFGDDGLYLGSAATNAVVGDGFDFLLTNSVITHLNGQTTNVDGIVVTGVGARKITIGDGNIISFCGRLGVQGTGHTFFSSAAKPTLILGNKGFAGIWYAAFGSTLALDEDYVRMIDGVHAVNNVGTGIEINNTGGGTTVGTYRPAVLKRSILSGNATNLVINNTNQNGDVTIDRVTLGKASGKALQVESGNASNITVLNSIFAGNGVNDANNVVNHSGSGTMTLNGVAIVTAGPLALNSGTPVTGTGTVSGAAATNADPLFVQTASPKAAGFFDVASGAYVNVNSTGAELAGGAKYVGPSSSVSDWNLF